MGQLIAISRNCEIELDAEGEIRITGDLTPADVYRANRLGIGFRLLLSEAYAGTYADLKTKAERRAWVKWIRKTRQWLPPAARGN
ncbi:MAG: hypothetical protein FJZ00_00415 [Candidatus Sericytochromatia bacterium]|uniref:Uncharacterized protein n=1 Tax=Candidatus Tanganyikabacteria bacterium TaxID=2961651 RepID=A0A937X1K6_9BACT|nr:hypothetical protein [Candidatus Tanganyikabacteria bacterium]